MQAAEWLDASLKSRGAFAAAREALDRLAERFPDLLVLREADRRRREAPHPVLPWKALGVRLAAFTLAAAATAGGLLLLPESIPARLAWPADHETARALPAPPEEFGSGKASVPTLSPKETARRLFPEDERLAALAEQALASGDAGALDALLSQNPSVPSDTPDSHDPTKRKQVPGASGQGGPGLGSGEGGEGSPSTPGGPGVDDRDKARRGDKPGGDQPSPGSAGGSGRGQSQPGGEGNSDAGGRPGSDQFPPGGPGNPGTGHSDQPLAYDPKTSADRQVVIPSRGAPGVFETILPESGARVPLSQVLPDRRRSAEAALDRTSTPLEFENAVRQYFLSLSQEAKP
jgi:hypothetical protein